MVIVINEKNQDLYNDFFIKAYQDAKEAGVVFEGEDDNQTAFTDLYQYYHYLPQLAARKPVYYTKLPLDEPMAEINGDSREVKVPAQLQKCAGIQNDHLAESIMFSIGRYHDGQDLMNATIWIQWTAENNGEKVEGVTAVPADYRDIDFKQHTIRFPWILDSSVTQYPGTIEFSAVFFSMTEGTNNIAYRYSTLPARIKIEPALQKDLPNNALDVGGMFAAAVRSNSYGTGFYIPVTPYFISTQGGIDLAENSDLIYQGDEDTVGSLTLEAQATVTDTGIVSYSWKHILPESSIEFDCGNVEDFTIPAGTSMTTAEINFVKTYTDPSYTISLGDDGKTTKEEKISYEFGTVNNSAVKLVADKNTINKFDRYYSNSSGTIEHTSETLEKAIADNENIYEKVTQFELPNDATNEPVTGEYFVIATNEVEIYDTPKQSEAKMSNITTLISPRKVAIGEKNTIETVTFTDGQAVLDTKLTQVAGENYVMSMKKSIAGVSRNNSTGVLSLKSGNTVSDLTFNLENNTISVPLSKEAGWYQATITAKRNREEKNDVTKIWRVVEQVTAPPLKDAGDNEEHSTDSLGTIVNANTNSITLSVAVGDDTLADYFKSFDADGMTNLKTDGYRCVWSQLEDDKGYVPKKTETSGNFTVTNPETATVYQCELINTLNGETASSIHRFYVM